jgi:hypothetical protein
MLPAPCRSQQSAATETLRAYLQGLSDAGWRGDSWLARFGYTASATLRYTVMTVAEMPGDTRDEGRYAAIEQRRGLPIEQVMEQHAVLIHFLLGPAEEARGLRPAVTAAATMSARSENTGALPFGLPAGSY